MRLFTRRGRAHHDRFPRLNAELGELPAGTVLDGELVCLERLDGNRVRCRFDRLSGFMAGRAPHRPSRGLTVTLIAFDALAVAGVDQRTRPWEERRQQLERLLAGADGPLRLTPVLTCEQVLHDALIAAGWEGTVAKRQAGRYVCGRRSSAWLKVKRRRRGTVIGGASSAHSALIVSEAGDTAISAMYVSLSRLRIDAQRAPELVAAFRARARLVDDADGFIDLQVWQSDRNASEIVMVSRWRDRQAFTQYMRSEAHRVSHNRINAELQAAIKLERLEHMHTFEVVAE